MPCVPSMKRSDALGRSMKRVAFFLVIVASPASAHDWYVDTVDPVTGIDCCGEVHCHPIDPADIDQLSSGRFLFKPRRWEIPANRVQPSHDFNFHICEGPRVMRERYVWNWFCFFAPPGSM